MNVFELPFNRFKIIEELNTKQRTLITVRVLLYDSERKDVMQSDFEWFIAKNEQSAQK